MIFCPDDVGQNNMFFNVSVFIHLGNQTGRNSSHMLRKRNTCIHQCERSATDTGHGSGPIGRHDFRYDTDRIGEFIFWREYGEYGALGKSTMTDFPATGKSKSSCLSYGKGREIVVQDEGLGSWTTRQTVQILNITACTKCTENQ